MQIRKWIVGGFLLIVGVAGLLYVNYESCYLALARWQVEKGSRNLFGRTIDYQAMRLEEGVIVLDNPTLDDGERLLRAERIEVRSHLIRRTGTPKLEVLLVRPHLALATGKGGGKFGLENLQKLIQGTQCIEVRGGVVELIGDGPTTRYEIEANLGKEAHLTVASEGEKQVSVALRGEALRCAFHDTPTSTLVPLIRALHPDLEMLREGRVSGRLVVRMPKGSAPYLDGRLKLRQTHVGIRGGQMELGCDEGLLTFDEGRAQLDLRKGGRLLSFSETLSSWAAQEFTGQLKYEDRWISIDLAGEITHAQESFPLQVRGDLPIGRSGGFSGARLHIAWPEDELSFAEVRGYELPSGATSLSIWLSNLRQRQTVLIHSFAQELFPSLPKLKGDRLSGRVQARFHEGQLQELRLSEFVGEGLAFGQGPLQGEVAKAVGDLRLRVTPDLTFTDATGTFEVEGGALTLRDYQLTGINANGLLGSGRLQQAQISGRFGGLATEIEMSRPAGHAQLQLKAEGAGSALRALLPVSADRETFAHFADEPVTLSAQLDAEEEAFVTKGKIVFGDASVPFGMHLRLKRDGDTAPWMPLILSLVDHPYHRWKEGAPTSFSVEKGWFTGEDIDLARYVRPFLSLADEAVFGGRIATRGRFDNSEVTLSYAGRGLLLDTDEMRVELPEVAGATYHFDLKEGTQMGTIPMRGGRYLEKHLDLQFEAIDAEISLGENLFVEVKSAEWEDLHCQGSVALEGDLVKIRAPHIEGSAPSVRALLRRTCDVSCWEWGIEGRVATRGAGVSLDFHLGDEVTMMGSVALQIEDGSWGPLCHAAVEIDYDHDRSYLRVGDLEGSLTLADHSWDVEAQEWSIADVVDPQIGLNVKVGPLTGHIGYSEGKLAISAQGEEVELGGVTLKDVAATSWQSGQEWALQITSDRLEGTASGGVEGSRWEVEKSQFDAGSALSLQMTGSFAEGRLKADLQRVTLNLASLGHRGYLQGGGSLQADVGGVSGDLTLTGQSLFFDGLQLCNRLPFEVKFSGKEVSVQGLNGWLIRDGSPIRVQADTVHWSPQKWALADLSFAIPRKEMEWIAADLSSQSDLPPAFWDLLRDLKSEGELVGRLSLDKADSLSFEAHLRSDTYHILGGDLFLSDLRCCYGDGALEVRGKTPFREESLSLLALWSDERSDQLRLLVDERPPEVGENALAFDYQLTEEGAELKRLSGGMAGLAVDLECCERGGADILALDGKVTLTFPDVERLLPAGLHPVFEKGMLGDSFTFSGSFALPKRELSQLAFRGSLVGEECVILGRRWRSLAGQVTVAPGRCDLAQLVVGDEGGAVEIDEFTARRDKQGEWHLAVPKLSVTDLRPSQLRRPDNSLGAASDLRITSAELHDIKGTSTQMNSWSGRGTLDFSNLPENDYSGTILAIPEELLSKLGLNPGNLIPAQGRIQCRLRGDKLVITRLDHVYSRGKHSQFLLANRSGESTVGLDGSLDLKIRMKQYNLLLKPAELFRYTIRGNLAHPKIGVEPKKSHRRWG